MTIPFVNLTLQYKSIQQEVDSVIADVLKKSVFVGGEYVERFEKQFKEYLHVKHCIGVNSGTDALILGLRALNLSENDEVIIPANTFYATAIAVTENRLKPVFVDCDNEDYGIDLTDLKKKITSSTKAVIVVHLYGQPDKIEEIQRVISSFPHKIHLVEDACQAHGAEYQNKKVGTFGIFSTFSFYPAKNLGAYGDGGAIVTNDDNLAKKLKLLREYGQEKKYIHIASGVNSRLDTIQAAVLSIKLQHLDDWNAKRRSIAETYRNNLSDISHIVTPQNYPARGSVYHLFVIRSTKREQLIADLASKNIQTLIHYPIPLHMQKAFANLNYRPRDLPNASQQAEEILSLPLFPEMKRQEVRYVIDNVINSINTSH